MSARGKMEVKTVVFECSPFILKDNANILVSSILGVARHLMVRSVTTTNSFHGDLKYGFHHIVLVGSKK